MSHPEDPYAGEEGLAPVRQSKAAKKASLDAMLPEMPEASGDLDGTLAFADMNDFGNANRLIHRHGDDMLFVRDIGWFIWDRTRWNHETGSDEAIKRAHLTARAIVSEVHALKDRGDKYVDRAGLLARHAVASGNQAKTHAMLAAAAVYKSQRIEALDSDPFLLASPGGTIRLASQCSMRENRRDDLMTRSLGTAYREGAQCPIWEKFLIDIMPDADMRAFLQRICGYCLTASTSEQAFFIFWGSGKNGKSTFVDAIREVMGDYAINSPVSTFLAKRDGNSGSEASPDLARLPGARLVTAAEPPEGARLDEAKIKEMSGGELMTARHLNQGFFDFKPVFKAVISTNHRPSIRGADHGIWRRVRLVPFTVQIPDNKVDRDLGNKLRKEREGILQWMITGAEDWFQQGLNPPKQAIAAVEDYRASEDPVGEFLKARCELPGDMPDPSTGRPYEIGAKALRAAYKAWCDEEGLEPLRDKAFGSKVIARGISTRKSHGLTVYVGVCLRTYMAGEAGDLGGG